MSSPQSRDHAWLPRASCDAECLRASGLETSRRVIVALRVARRITLALLLAPALTVLAVVLPGWSKARQVYCRLLLWCLGVRITLSGGPIRNLPGVLVVSDHMSWLDVVTIGAVLPAGRWRPVPLSFVARADVAGNLAVRMMARIVKAIPIERNSLRRLPEVVAAVAARLYAGHTVVAFPEGTTWCGMPGDDAAAARGGGTPSRGAARGEPGNRAMRARKPANRTAGPGRSIRRCFRPPSTPADRSSRCGCAITIGTAASRQSRPISATTRCCVRSVGCWSPAAPWRGFTSNHCSCPATIGGSWPVAARPRYASQRPRTQVMGSVRPCWRPDRSRGVGILGRSWSTWITPLPPRCTPLPSRR
jgi:1-acyl-sn-glycerol-3-phosphate acyltransferase